MTKSGKDYRDYNLTPTQELMMEVLLARHRLGEHWWTFTSSAANRVAASWLKRKGLVSIAGGQTARTFRVSLSEEGKDLLDEDYVPPILRKDNPRTPRTFTITVTES